jgi:hypothetical protein
MHSRELLWTHTAGHKLEYRLRDDDGLSTILALHVENKVFDFP